jgi:hypothetical protein
MAIARKIEKSFRSRRKYVVIAHERRIGQPNAQATHICGDKVRRR